MLPYRYLIGGAAILVVVAGFAGYVIKLKQTEQEYARYRESVAATNAQLQAENAARVRQHEALLADTKSGYERAVADLARGFDSRLERLRREAAGHRATLSLTASATAGPDGPAAEPPSGADAFTTACLETERAAASDALQLIWLQHWAKGIAQ